MSYQPKEILQLAQAVKCLAEAMAISKTDGERVPAVAAHDAITAVCEQITASLQTKT